MEKLDWIPLYVDNILDSPRWRAMKDFQRGWYFQLILESVRSERPGFLRLRSDLWILAGAHCREMWDNHSSAVMACFKVQVIDAHSWIFNERLLRTLEEQSKKYEKQKKRNTKHISSLEIKEQFVITEVLKNKAKPGNIEEVAAYCQERANEVDPQHFLDYYETRGWLLSNGRTVKDWKAAVRTWEKNGFTSAAKWRNGNDIPKEKGACAKHPGSGLTTTGRCWACYAEHNQSARLDAT